jgi:hypothetical protein
MIFADRDRVAGSVSFFMSACEWIGTSLHEAGGPCYQYTAACAFTSSPAYEKLVVRASPIVMVSSDERFMLPPRDSKGVVQLGLGDCGWMAHEVSLSAQ